jgi:beta-glucosidase
LNIGGVVDMTPWRRLTDAILICWQPGEEGGNTVASVLDGSVNPSGRLPMTISRAYEYEPSAPNFPRINADKPFNYSFYRRLAGNKKAYDIKDVDYTDYEEDIYVGYRYFQTKDPRHVAYPFGYGLSYTDFTWNKMRVAEAGDGWDVTVDVKNSGDVAGKDVVELFVHAPGKDMDKPERELKAFAKTPLLEPGETATVTLHVTRDSLASWDEEAGAWALEPGRYRFLACSDAATVILRKRVRI